jgi:hypothetical protein
MTHSSLKTILSLVFFITLFTKTLNAQESYPTERSYDHSEKDINTVRQMLQKKYSHVSEYFIHLEHMILGSVKCMHAHEKYLKQNTEIPPEIILFMKNERRKLNNRIDRRRHTAKIKAKQEELFQHHYDLEKK